MNTINTDSPVAGEIDRAPGWIRRLAHACWLHRRVAIGALLVTVIASAIDISFPLLTRYALDAAGQENPGKVIGFVALAIAVLAVVRFACQYGRRMLAGRLSLDVQHDLRLALLGSLQRLDGRGQDQIRTGQVVSRSITDLQLVQGLLAMVPMSAGALLQFVLAIGIMAWLSPLLTLVAVCSVILLVFKWSMSSVVVLSSLIGLVGLSIVADQFRTSSQLNIRWVLLSFALLIAAVACRELDIARRFSSPQSWLQGHAFWHVLTSLSLASIYVYYRSETIMSDTFDSD